MGSVTLLKQAHARLVNAVCRQKVVFHHVPKCGGTSIARAFRMRYLPSQATVLPEQSYRALELFEGSDQEPGFLDRVYTLRQQMFIYHLMNGVKCITAHVHFSNAAFDRFCNDYKFVSVLREPVSRYISHYFYSFGKDAHGGIHKPIEEFVESERGRDFGAEYVFYFADLPPGADLHAREAIERAKANIARLHVVGLLENLPKFGDDVSDALGVRVRFGHENKGRVDSRTKQRVISAEVKDRIQELCQPDTELYEFARSLTS